LNAVRNQYLPGLVKLGKVWVLEADTEFVPVALKVPKSPLPEMPIPRLEFCPDVYLNPIFT